MTPAVQFPLLNDRPTIQVSLPRPSGGPDLFRTLIADTGAGTQRSVFQIVLQLSDCLQCGGIPITQVQLTGAYTGSFPLFLVRVRIPRINFDEPVPVVGVMQIPRGFDGIAAFRFLNRFHYGNFANPACVGLDLLPTV